MKGHVDDMKSKDYLAVDDVNHRFINTNRKLKEKRTHCLKKLYFRYNTVVFSDS